MCPDNFNGPNADMNTFCLCLIPYATVGWVLVPLIVDLFWCNTIPNGIKVSSCPLKYGAPWAYILPVLSILTNVWSYDPVWGAMLADKVPHVKYFIVGYGLSAIEAFKLTIIPEPLCTVYTVDDAVPIKPPFNKPEYKLPSIQRKRVIFEYPFPFWEKYRSSVEPET